ncbi:hypothetical protein KRP22_000191 [Phytophthora ramorum]|nr:hypothetical protein KRP22_12137 [Phytophthora ramorum]
MGVEVDAGDGRLRGVVLSSGDPTLAFVDSPELHVYVGADERDYLVFRMKYLGQCDLAMISLERAPSERPVWPDADPRVMNDPIRIPFKLHTNALEQDDLYFIPIWKHVTGVIRRVRFHPCVSRPKVTGQSFSIDWVTLTKAPVVTKVRGCIDKYFDDDDTPGSSGSDTTAHLNCTETERWTNGFHHTSSAVCSPMQLPRASTYNCAREGGELLSISGKHFGTADAIISIDGVECLDIVHVVPEVELQCRLPAVASKWLENPTYPSVVRVYNGRLLQLFDEVPLLSYAAPVKTPPTPIISNVAAHALDVNWQAPVDVWMSMTVTGYRVAWKQCSESTFSPKQTIVVGNVTSTTLIELESSTSYQVKVTPLTENQWQWLNEWKDIDLYGHRSILPNAVVGVDSPVSSCVHTLDQDFVFPQFSARLLTNLSALPEAVALRTSPTLGPTGEVGDQGHFGLYVNGDTHQELALGSGGMALGYGGLQNALAIEFDTWFNPELLDVYENHISVHVSGNGGVLQADHTHSLGSTSNLPDMTEDTHIVRITYKPNLDESMLFDEAFTASTLAGNFFSTGAWRSGIGLLVVYLDDMNSPVLTVPLRIENTLELFHGRAWVGFTGATGEHAWQTLDIMSWDFQSLRQNIVTTPQLRVS